MHVYIHTFIYAHIYISIQIHIYVYIHINNSEIYNSYVFGVNSNNGDTYITIIYIKT